ncbi:hypothetical protein E2C01_077992 [Portunus trituberculatus]|uniref:Uncharacterized protein n=1 Tax=Portunus trituberculatus TaxID=210409 RepID=A0A5B7ILQ3_PORTR|nr:hypothetical protein [Portunus trituberculatus]
MMREGEEEDKKERRERKGDETEEEEEEEEKGKLDMSPAKTPKTCTSPHLHARGTFSLFLCITQVEVPLK